jgi:hypothetical protein
MTTEELVVKARVVAQAALAQGHPPATAADEAIRVVVTDLQAMLSPEEHPGYDPEHVFWGSHEPGDGEVFEWSAETIEWVSEWAARLLKAVGE